MCGLLVTLVVGSIITGCKKTENAVVESENTVVTEREYETKIEKETMIETESEFEIEVERETKTKVRLSKGQQYVMDLFKLILGREADESALEYFEKLLLDENKGVRHVILILFQSEEFKNRKVDKEEFVKILFDVTMGRKASKEELQEQSKDLKDYSDYIVLLVHFLELEEFSEKVEKTRIPVGSIPSINGEVVILNDGVIVTTAEKYGEGKDNIKFKYPVPKGKQNIVIELRAEKETEKEVETVAFQEQPQTNINNNWEDNGGVNTPTVVIETPQQTQAQTQQTTQVPQTEPQTQAQVWVVTKEAWEEVVPKYEWQLRMICACGYDITGWTEENITDHLFMHIDKDEPYGSWATKMVEVQTGTEMINHPEEGYWR